MTIDHDRDLRLPEGKTCGDCTRYERCRARLGKSSHATRCYTGPSLFEARAERTLHGDAGFAVNDIMGIRAAAKRIADEEQAAAAEIAAQHEVPDPSAPDYLVGTRPDVVIIDEVARAKGVECPRCRFHTGVERRAPLARYFACTRCGKTFGHKLTI